MPEDGNNPVLLEADNVQYDQGQNIVTASGNVEVVQGGRILRAERLRFFQRTNTVTAEGNVSILEPNGNVYFAEEATLQNELMQGVVEELRVRLPDASLFAARQAEKQSKDVTVFSNAVYSPCKVCPDEEGRDEAPFWQVKARTVTYDQAAQRVQYEHAWMEVMGIPVLYLPYFSHVTPDAPRKSGFLMPSYGASTSLGTTVEVPYYVNIAPNMDATVTPMFTSREGAVMRGQFRHLTESGRYEISGSITNPKQRDNVTGEITSGRELRGHIEAAGNFTINDRWQWGFVGRRASDDTYLRRYEISNDDTLTSRLFLEGLDAASHPRTYALVEGLSFQGLNPEDDADTTPYILPLVSFSHQTEPGWRNSRFLFDVGTMVLGRSEGSSSQRLSSEVGWSLPYQTTGGHLFDVNASLRGDVYFVQEHTDLAGNEVDETEARLIPELSLGWRYPLAGDVAGIPVLIEPIAQAIVSPHGNNPDEIPNEDSQVFEFSAINLFDRNRYTGFDRVESGPRANYGVRGSANLTPTRNISAVFGQNYQLKADEIFSFGSDPDSHFSDYVGQLGYQDEWLHLLYRFRLAEENFATRSNNVNAIARFNPIYLNIDFLSLDDDPNLGDVEEIFAGASYVLNENWTISGGGRRDLSDGGSMIDGRAGLTYHNDCLTIMTSVQREFTRFRDVEPSTSFLLQVSLRNVN